MPIPCHLIVGPLGVGKTTAILDFVTRNAGWERTAVLVNDFGPIGLDGPILESGGVSEVVSIPGGCVCCSAAEGLLSAMRKIALLPKITRIIVEPSGLAAPSEIIDHLRSLASEFDLELRPVIGILDLRDIDEVIDSRMPFYQRLVESADILVANRSDVATSRKAARFLEWARGLYPPKLQALVTHHGQLPDRLFESPPPPKPTRIALAIRDDPGRQNTGRLQHDHKHHAHAHGAAEHAGGLILEATTVFNLARIEVFLLELVGAGFQGVRPLRLKAALHTDAGWKLVEIARGDVFVRATEYRRDNRIDWITGEKAWDDAAFGAMFRSLGSFQE